jgi:hypothetical protein
MIQNLTFEGTQITGDV